MIIADWWYAYKVCRKYRVSWNPFRSTESALYKISWNRWGICEQTISINPFYKGFLDSFLHEIGHLVWYKRIYKQSNTMEEFEVKMNEKDILYQEFVAWRFAKLSRKGGFNKNRARWMFSTYFPVLAKEVGGPTAANVYYTYDRRIEK